MITETYSEQETITFAKAFAEKLVAGDVVLLQGDLGMGKSVFCRALLRAMCGNENMEVPSPTFTLVQTYEADLATIWHFDLYRLSDQEEIYELGWEDALAEKGILLIEWPDRLGSLCPKKHIEIIFTPILNQPDGRKIEVIRHE